MSKIEKLHPWSERMLGANLAVQRLYDLHIKTLKLCKEERVYLEAEIALILSDLRYMEMWLTGWRIGYRNFRKDKKGKLQSAEAYFFEEKISER